MLSSTPGQTTRLETFVDAAFAFALTMLVISVDSIPQSFVELIDALKRVPAFAASFTITVMFWHGHYRWSRRFGLEDGWSVVLSLVLVFLVLVFLYPLRLMMSGAFNAFSGGLLPAELEITELSHVRGFFVLYGLAFALMSGVLLALNAHVLRLQLVPPLNAVSRLTARSEIEAWAILAAMGAISASLALVLPPRLVALSVWLYVGLAVIMPLMSRRWRRLGAAAEALERSHKD
jgi:uncharacterized membrane protein